MNSATEQFIESESRTESFSNSKENDEITDIPIESNEDLKNDTTEQLVNGNSPNYENTDESSDPEADTNENATRASGDNSSAEKEPEIEEWQDLLGSGSIMKKILIEGKPDSRPQRLERCTINYECSVENGDFVEKQENLEVLLGDHEVSTYIKTKSIQY